MMGPSHSRAGVAAWFAWTTWQAYQGQGEVLDVYEVTAGAVLSGAASRGWLSPDIDGHRWLGRVIPGGHRGPLHCPDFVLVLSALLWHFSASSGAHFAVQAVTIGWASHLLGDFFFGGVPFLLLGGKKRYGPDLDTDGWFEVWIVRRLLLAAAVPAGVLAVATSFYPALPAEILSVYASGRH
jgi:hypothetical protein